MRAEEKISGTFDVNIGGIDVDLDGGDVVESQKGGTIVNFNVRFPIFLQLREGIGGGVEHMPKHRIGREIMSSA